MTEPQEKNILPTASDKDSQGFGSSYGLPSLDHPSAAGSEHAYVRESFGEYLKRHREASGKTLDSVSRATRIAKRFLQAFEDNDLKNIPDAAFRRGFLRSYSIEIGMDPDECLMQYDEFVRSLSSSDTRESRREKEKEKEKEKAPLFHVSENPVLDSGTPQKTGSSSNLSWIVGIGIFAAIVIAGALWITKFKDYNFQSSTATVGVDGEQGEPQDATEQSVDLTLNRDATPATEGEAPVPITKPEDAPPPAAASANTATPSEAKNAPAAAPGTGAAAANASSSAMVAPAKPSVLQIRSLRAAKISIRLDENALQELNFQPGESQTLFVFREAEIRSSDRGAFQFQYNGKAMEVSGPVMKIFNRNLFQNQRR